MLNNRQSIDKAGRESKRIIKALEIITRHWKYRECSDTPEKPGWSEFNDSDGWTTVDRGATEGVALLSSFSENPKELVEVGCPGRRGTPLLLGN